MDDGHTVPHQPQGDAMTTGTGMQPQEPPEIPTEDLTPEELQDEAFRTRDGAGSGEPLDPAMAPVIEAGGGVAEGFEQSEALLVDHAEGAEGGTERILRDAFTPEAGQEHGVYGEADEEASSERTDR